MARRENYETQLRNFHAQGFSRRTMASLLNLSPSTVARRLKKLGLSVPLDPTPRESTKRRSHNATAILETMLDDLRELVNWWRDRREALQHVQEASRKMQCVTFQVEQRWIEAIRRQAELDGTPMSQIVNQAFQAFFVEREA
jgi:hypothetical protein